MAVLRQSRAGFRGDTSRIRGKEVGKRVSDARLGLINRAVTEHIKRKTLNTPKAKQMLEIVKPRFRPVVEEMFLVINSNPLLAVGDLAVQVIRNLKQKYPKDFYATGAIERLYTDAVNCGAIQLEKSKQN